MVKKINSWSIFDFRPRVAWYQALYVGLTWGVVGWTIIMLGFGFLITYFGK